MTKTVPPQALTFCSWISFPHHGTAVRPRSSLRRSARMCHREWPRRHRREWQIMLIAGPFLSVGPRKSISFWVPEVAYRCNKYFLPLCILAGTNTFFSLLRSMVFGRTATISGRFSIPQPPQCQQIFSPCFDQPLKHYCFSPYETTCSPTDLITLKPLNTLETTNFLPFSLPQGSKLPLYQKTKNFHPGPERGKSEGTLDLL